MKTIQICDGPEARLYFSQGRFFELFDEYLDEYGFLPKLNEIREVKLKYGFSLPEAKELVCNNVLAEHEAVRLQYSGDGAVQCDRWSAPKVARKIGEVWVCIEDFSNEVSESILFDSVRTCSVTGLGKLRTGHISTADAVGILSSIKMAGVPYRISSGEYWIRRNGADCICVYTVNDAPESIRVKDFKKENIGGFITFLESRLERRRNAFGEF